MIETKNLHIGHSSTLLSIDNIKLEKGELYFLVGKNGSGKSTLLKTIVGEISPIEGDVILEDVSIKRMSFKQIPKIIAFVNTRFPSTDYLTAEEYVTLARTPYTNHFGAINDQDQKIIDDAFDTLGIQELKHRFTSELSDGEKQMVSIAKAIAQETPIIILDEPTAFLDYTNKQKVVHLLKRISAEMNKCIIMSTHDIDTSVNSNCSFLAVNAVQNRIELVKAPTTKQSIIDISF